MLELAEELKKAQQVTDKAVIARKSLQLVNQDITRKLEISKQEVVSRKLVFSDLQKEVEKSEVMKLAIVELERQNMVLLE